MLSINIADIGVSENVQKLPPFLESYIFILSVRFVTELQVWQMGFQPPEYPASYVRDYLEQKKA